jgi:SAM-dependent methyltransferase
MNYELPDSDGVLHLDPEKLTKLLEGFDLKSLTQVPDVASWGQMNYHNDSYPGATRLMVNIESHPNFAQLDPHVAQWGARTADTVLNMAQGHKYLDLSSKKKILDFGAGSGGPTLALVQLAEQTGGKVEAVEPWQKGVAEIVESGVLPAEDVYVEDGIEFLSKRGQSGNKFDLITAFMFGPDADGSFSNQLIAAASRALEPSGQLLVTSDGGTMEAVQHTCDLRGVKYEHIYAIPGEVPETVIITFPQRAGF